MFKPLSHSCCFSCSQFTLQFNLQYRNNFVFRDISHHKLQCTMDLSVNFLLKERNHKLPASCEAAEQEAFNSTRAAALSVEQLHTPPGFK